MTAPAETAGNETETLSDPLGRIELHLEEIALKIDHLDEQLHGLVRLIDEHRPLLARAQALAGTRTAAWMSGRKKTGNAVPPRQ